MALSQTDQLIRDRNRKRAQSTAIASITQALIASDVSQIIAVTQVSTFTKRQKLPERPKLKASAYNDFFFCPIFARQRQ